MIQTRLNLERWQDRLSPLLRPCSAIYAAGMNLRHAAYKTGWIHSWRPPAPCISVGNISWGGSGKTPLCAWLLQWALQHGLQPALLSRGYQGHAHNPPLLVTMDTLPAQSGDEALLLARQCPQARILVDPKRHRAGRWIARHMPPDIYIMDDGFQHMAVQRDLDLVLLRTVDLQQQWNRVIPRGSWREGASALRRASAFLIKIQGQDFQSLLPEISARLGHLNRPVFSFALRIKNLLRLMDGCRVDNQAWNQNYVLLSAVGDPQGVQRDIAQYLQREALEHFAFRDHASYSESMWQRIEARAKQNDAAIVCTPKDAVKLEVFASSRLWTVELEVDFGPYLFSTTGFQDWIEARVSAQQK